VSEEGIVEHLVVDIHASKLRIHAISNTLFQRPSSLLFSLLGSNLRNTCIFDVLRESKRHLVDPFSSLQKFLLSRPVRWDRSGVWVLLQIQKEFRVFGCSVDFFDALRKASLEFKLKYRRTR
jgi:hypothetical protein